MRASQSYAGHHAEAAYSRWAPVYDLVFDLPFHPGRPRRRARRREAAGPGGEILVIGVGTGLELPLLPGNVLVTGIDISAPMLRAARSRVERQGLAQVKGLHVMDAGALDFPDAAFDVALAPYVMSVVPHPEQALDGGVAGLAAGRDARRDESFRRRRRPAQGRGARDGNGRRAGSAGIRTSPIPRSATGSPPAADARVVERSELPPMKLFTLLRIEKAPR